MRERGVYTEERDVVFVGATDAQAYFAGCDDPRDHLIEGALYTVVKVHVHSWHTKVRLLGFEDLAFNSVVFRPVDKQEE